MNSVHGTLLAGLCLLCGACASAPARTPGADATPLILISLDGFHPDLLDAHTTPTLARLAREGVHAEGMIPSYPSLTFPNHYTLVTGLRPDHHGIVDNTMRDPQLGSFDLHDRASVEEGRWWGGEPLWVSLHHVGVDSATMFWPGSESPIQGVQPRFWRRFDESVSPRARVQQVLAWLDLPAHQRPRFVTLYFEHTDHAGHESGPDSDPLRAAATVVDAALRRLVRGLARRGVHANLIVVSDHGMAGISLDRVIAIEDVVPADAVDVVTEGSMLTLAPKSGREAEVARALRGPHDHLQCWPKRELPLHWHYGSHARVPPWVCQMQTGWRIHPAARIAEWRRRAPGRRGAHGFDPLDPAMRALFVAHGPDFARGKRIPAFDNVHVHALMAHLLEVEVTAGEGDLAVLAPALAHPPDADTEADPQFRAAEESDPGRR